MSSLRWNPDINDKSSVIYNNLILSKNDCITYENETYIIVGFRHSQGTAPQSILAYIFTQDGWVGMNRSIWPRAFDIREYDAIKKIENPLPTHHIQ